MCNQDRGAGWWLLALFFLLALFAARTVSGDETSASSPLPTQSEPGPLPLSGSSTQSEAWELLMRDWFSFAPLWESLIAQSQALGIGIDELPDALKTTRESLASLQVSYQAEVAARLKAERARNRMQALAIAEAGGIAVLAVVVGILAAR